MTVHSARIQKNTPVLHELRSMARQNAYVYPRSVRAGHQTGRMYIRRKTWQKCVHLLSANLFTMYSVSASAKVSPATPKIDFNVYSGTYLGPCSKRLCTMTSSRCCPTKEDRERSRKCWNTPRLDEAAMRSTRHGWDLLC